jgi:hypothetical protein
MKPPRLKFVLLASLSFALIVTNIHADEPPAAIYKATGPIKIDGVLDEPAWKEAVAVQVVNPWGRVGPKSEEPRMLARFTWDDQYLYIGYETFDKNLLALGTGETEGPKDNPRQGAQISNPTVKVDVVEFFVSFGDQQFFWELHHNGANQFNDIWCAVVDEKSPIGKTTIARYGIYFGNREIVQDDPDAGAILATAAAPKPKADGKPSTLNDPSDTDTGYVGEIRLPWLGLGAPTASENYVMVEPKEAGGAKKRIHGPWKMAGQEMLILSVFQDGDLKDHYHHSSPTFPGGWFHKGSVHWPKYVLKDALAK